MAKRWLVSAVLRLLYTLKKYHSLQGASIPVGFIYKYLSHYKLNQKCKNYLLIHLKIVAINHYMFTYISLIVKFYLLKLRKGREGRCFFAVNLFWWRWVCVAVRSLSHSGGHSWLRASHHWAHPLLGEGVSLLGSSSLLGEGVSSLGSSSVVGEGVSSLGSSSVG